MGQTPLVGRVFRRGRRSSPARRRSRCCRITTGATRWTSRADAIGRTLQIGREHLHRGRRAVAGHRVRQHRRDRSVAAARARSATARATRGTCASSRGCATACTFDQAAAEMAAIGDALATEYPLTNGGWTMRLVPIREITGGEGFWVVIALFLLSIGLLMAIATANVSNLVMVRAASRARASWRCAPRWARASGRLLRQFVDRRAVAVGDRCALRCRCRWRGRAAGASQRSQPEAVFQQIAIDAHELAFVAHARADLPARVFARAGPAAVASRSARTCWPPAAAAAPRRRCAAAASLVVVQVALAVILLTASSLALRSMREHLFGADRHRDRRAADLRARVQRRAVSRRRRRRAPRPRRRAMSLAAVPGVETRRDVNALPMLGDHGPLRDHDRRRRGRCRTRRGRPRS